MKKKIILIICIVIIALAGAAFAGLCYYRDAHVTIGGETYPRTVETLDLSSCSAADLEIISTLPYLRSIDLRDANLTVQEYEAVCAAAAGCEITWSVPFQGGHVPCETRELTVSALSEEDIAMLAWLPQLTAVNAEACSDYDAILALKAAYPQLEVTYQVALNGETYDPATTELTLAQPVADLADTLAYLPQMQTVTFTETPANPDDILALQEAYPNITFSWQLEVCGVTVDASATEIDLSEIPLADTQELESKLKYMPNLTKVDMVHCGISNQDMEALNNRHENILFVWAVKLKGMEFRTDVTEMMPVKHDLWVTDEDCYNLRYFTELIALDLGHMFINHCEFVRYMPHLKYLILADTDVTSIAPLENLTELIFLEIFMCPIQDYSPLVTLTALEDLNISYTYGDYELIAQMTWLDHLWWGQTPESRITDAQRDYLRSVLVDTQIEFQPQSSTGKGWRLIKNYFDMRDIFGMGYMTK